MIIQNQTLQNPCISKDDQSDKLTEKPIEDTAPKHEHFLTMSY